MERKQDILHSVKNAFRILNSFSLEEPEKGISDLAKTLGLGKSSVSRLMSTMASEGYVIKNPETNRYRLGLSVLSLTGIVTSNLDVHNEAVPVLNKLVNDVDETAHLVILEQTEVVYLHKIECNHPVRFFSYVGRKNPSYCTSSGKAILAYQPMEVVDHVIESGLIKYTNNTITNPDQFKEHLSEIRKYGYSYSIEEFLEGVCSVGVPIRDYTGNVIASITIVGPKQRINQKNINLFAKKAMAAGKEISNNLGFFGSKS